MSRLTLLLPLLIYLTFDPRHARFPVGLDQVLLFAGLLPALPLAGRILAVRMVSRAHPGALHLTAARVNRLLGLARLAALLWALPALYVFGLAQWMSHLMVLPNPSALGAIMVTLPPYLAWLMLYWAQYPAERAIREQAMLIHLDEALPVHAAPRLHDYLGHHLRTGIGVFVVPVLCVLVVRDAMQLGLYAAGLSPGVYVQSLLFIVSSLLVFTLFPVMLVRLLRTRPLPPGPLRDKLEALARRSGVRARDILLWDTGHSTCNAMVTGMLPRVRYVLISDLLVEALRDEDIEAVFAHELGHIVHRHIAWYGVFLVSSALLLNWLDLALVALMSPSAIPLPIEVLAGAGSLAVMLLGFGYLSRRFENQADVYAARSMVPLTEDLPPDTHPLRIGVTTHGSAAFVHALSRVAWINNIPLSARNFTHGSIASRLARLSGVAVHPDATTRFDRRMLAIRRVLLALLALAVASLFIALWTSE